MRDKIKTITAERFRALLTVGRWSHRSLAEASGVSRSTIYSFANGRGHITLTACVRLAKTLGVRVSDFAP